MTIDDEFDCRWQVKTVAMETFYWRQPRFTFGARVTVNCYQNTAFSMLTIWRAIRKKTLHDREFWETVQMFKQRRRGYGNKNSNYKNKRPLTRFTVVFTVLSTVYILGLQTPKQPKILPFVGKDVWFKHPGTKKKSFDVINSYHSNGLSVWIRPIFDSLTWIAQKRARRPHITPTCKCPKVPHVGNLLMLIQFSFSGWMVTIVDKIQMQLTNECN